MATKPTKRKPAAKTSAGRKPRAAAAAAAAAPETGPVTLAEARALAAAKRPRLAARMASSTGAGPTTTTATSPEALGKERQKLEKRRRDEIARRVGDYADTMAIMKARGARSPRAKKAGPGGPTAAAAAKAGFQPLQVFAEGDSWFDYPLPFFGGGIVPRLESLLGVPILNLATAGDEVRYMLGVEQREGLARRFKEGCPNGGPWDVLLFSGGGNDIVDKPMASWVLDFDPSIPPQNHVHAARFDAALALVRAGYEDLIALRDKHSPTTRLVLHGYDFAIPDGRGACFNLFGPWLKPTFDLRGFPKALAPKIAVVRAMLEKFAAVLKGLAKQPNVTFIDLQGKLPQRTSSWDNELHPSSKGFDAFAAVFQAELRVLFPGRVA